MSKKTDADLAKAAVELRASNPQAWEVFLRCLIARCDENRNNCVFSPPDRLVFAQGAAQEAITFLGVLVNAPTEVEKLRELERKINGNPQHRHI
jgi:hypothetical protein